jgi:RNA polymerase sigma-70 factor (ECF subfamily)
MEPAKQQPASGLAHQISAGAPGNPVTSMAAASPNVIATPAVAGSDEPRPRTGHVMLVDFTVVERARAGDGEAFNTLVHAYRRRVVGTITRLIGRPEDVEDVAQEVFLRLYDSLEQLRTAEVFEPWLYRLTVNAAYDYLRRHRRRRESRMSDLSEQQVLQADAIAGGRHSDEEARRTKLRDYVQSILSQVSEQDRMLLLLKEVEGLSLKELEAVYRVNESALKVRLFRARQRVLKALGAEKFRGNADE